jgi:hypothetical protein
VGIDGVFVEVHDCPEKALSDGANACTLDLLADFWRSLLEVRSPCTIPSFRVPHDSAEAPKPKPVGVREE